MNDTPAPDRPNLATRLLAAAASMGSIRKTGYNSHFKYEFVTADDVVDTVRKTLIQHGVWLQYDGIQEVEYTQIGETRNGQPKFRAQLTVQYTAYNIDDMKDFLVARHVGEAIDQEDKAITKASTSAAKYALLRLFFISTGEPDDDIEQSSHPDIVVGGRRGSDRTDGAGAAGDSDEVVKIGKSRAGDGEGGGGRPPGSAVPPGGCAAVTVSDAAMAKLQDPIAEPLLVAIAARLNTLADGTSPKPTVEQVATTLLKDTVSFPSHPEDMPGDRIGRIAECVNGGNVDMISGMYIPF